MVVFESILAQQVQALPEITVNPNVFRKPSFGWGDSDALLKFLTHNSQNYSPLVWSVPATATASNVDGYFDRNVVLNLCVVETRIDMLNTVRLNPDKSFKTVLIPLWESLARRFSLSNITMDDELPSMDLFPNYAPDLEYPDKIIWDVLRVSFSVKYPSHEYESCIKC